MHDSDTTATAGQVYRLRADVERFRWLGVKKSSMPPLALLLQGSPLQEEWQVPVVEELLDDELPEGPLSDFPYLDGVPTLSRHAVNVLLDLLVENGELLPVQFEGGEFFVFNVTRVIDALDEERSSVKRFESSGRIMEITQFEFLRDQVSGLSVFKLPQMLKPLVLVTDSFVNRVRTAQLTGFIFEPVWNAST